ncbi:hypothetical protein DF17_12445 [Streptomyces rimosus]|nr:hypothetical protein DF17_12445 [Streptomyces rimosus]KEF14192.1 hypothetical protein DF18_35195 [Streptomyces rimosus]KUJ32573.1 hypothetical protein ADK46_21775 [Streptomyces rimosus subsp. rimosus]
MPRYSQSPPRAVDRSLLRGGRLGAAVVPYGRQARHDVVGQPSQALRLDVHDVDAQQDAFDLAVARHAPASELPLLAVCRGSRSSTTSLWAGRCVRMWAARRRAAGIAFTASRSRRGR